MLLSSNDPERGLGPENITGHIDRSAIVSHLQDFDTLDGRALLDTLAPHQDLPEFDPASYVIRFHRRLTSDSEQSTQPTSPVDSTYALGVVFGRSLLQRVVPDGLVPVISGDTNSAKKELVDGYLAKSAHVPVRKLTSNDHQIDESLERAVALFAEKCRVRVSHLMLDGDEELARGFHDYLGVVSLLDASHEAEPRTLRRVLGKFSVGNALRRIL